MNKKRGMGILLAAASTVLLGGCSRSMLNYQIAECIGTLNQYENNEPVETPKMKAERERQESEAAVEEEKTAMLEEAEALAQSYYYQEAMELLQRSELLEDDARAQEAMEKYEGVLSTMYEYKDDIGQLCFTNLIVDTERAFDGDYYSQTYYDNMITLEEFENILNTLYEGGYVLLDIHNLAEETTNGNSVQLTRANPKLPKGKKPLVLSVENLTYSSVTNGDGVATRLALDKNGEVGAVYTDAEGHDLVGAYDVVPVLEKFIEEHPDFSYQGARGIISLSGKDGAFGYQVEESADPNWQTNAETVRQIAEKLREDGWTFATAGYSYQYMGDFSYDSLKTDITNWQESIGTLVGECDVILYPYGDEVDYATEKAVFLTGQGYHYMVGTWADTNYEEVNETYLRQTRRMVIGYVLKNYPGYFTPYFGAGVLER